jgi:hypothetical protein
MYFSIHPHFTKTGIASERRKPIVRIHVRLRCIVVVACSSRRYERKRLPVDNMIISIGEMRCLVEGVETRGTGGVLTSCQRLLRIGASGQHRIGPVGRAVLSLASDACPCWCDLGSARHGGRQLEAKLAAISRHQGNSGCCPVNEREGGSMNGPNGIVGEG